MPRKLGRCCAHQIAGACSCRSPSFIRERGGLKTCQNSSRFNSNVDDENTLHFHHGSLRRTDLFYQLRVRGFLLRRFIFSARKRRADFYSSGRGMILTEKTRLTPWSWINVESMRIGYVCVSWNVPAGTTCAHFTHGERIKLGIFEVL